MTTNSQPTKDEARPILLVDDEEIVLVALRDTLLREGYHVVASPHAIHAVSVLEEQEFSVVISDQQMPLVSGLEFLTQVRGIQPNATRILITAVLNSATIIDAINKAEVYRFIVKPWSREDLLVTVKNAVQRYQIIAGCLRAQAETEAANVRLRQTNTGLEEEIARLLRVNQQLERAARTAHEMPLQ